mmetsp:Transcript_7764/g.22510  ORF Transcript_7764/g.22510 Transcript_7764/m.22510 type:complete len:1290 (+) Transcript_7764:137-4006(+)
MAGGIDVESAAVSTPQESTPLLGDAAGSSATNQNQDSRQALFDFLEAKTYMGRIYEYFIIALILVNVVAFILSSLFVEQYNPVDWAARDGGICGDTCDSIWFGNYDDNKLEFLGIGSTSVLEIFTVAVFSVEYVLRLYTADLEDAKYSGAIGRLRYIPSFFSVVDLASTVPFYIDAFVLPNTDLAASSFLRMFRLLRMMRVEGRYDTALTMVDDVYAAQKGILGTAMFVGFTTWMTVSSLMYLVERRSLDMIYCGASPDYCGDADNIDTSLCTIDYWGVTNCTNAGCPATDEYPEPCYNLFQSIPMASYYTLLNLFGEFPLVDQHTVGGMIVGTLTAVVAVAFFALPAGIIGNGFEDEIEKRRANDDDGSPIVERGGITEGYEGSPDTLKGRLYNFLHAMVSPGAAGFDNFINVLVVGTAATFMLDTLVSLPRATHIICDTFELLAVMIFTAEYVLRVYSASEDPKYQGVGGKIKYMTNFLPMVDLLSFLPFWIEICYTGQIITPYSDSSSMGSNLVKSLRLLRILRFEKYTHAFTSFDDVVSRNVDVLAVTGFTALLLWVFFGAFLYFTERDNPDKEMSSNYNTIPNSMWVTLLNLAGESPLCQYSVWGKIATGILGLFATGIFGIPIGILGAGFEEVVEEENEDNAEELERSAPSASQQSLMGSEIEQQAYKFVNGLAGEVSKLFEKGIYLLIFVAVAIGVWQTVDGHENDFSEVELFAVIVFTAEYLIRFIGVGADPQFAPGRNAITSRLRFIFSFYSIVDLLAIVPYYITLALPGSIVNEYDEYLRMLRILRLIKLDKYVPSITLIDDVIRLKFNALRVAFYAAVTLWILFASLIYVFEHGDKANAIDPVPDYGCDDECTMSNRFRDFFDSMVYTGIHLTGDYPIITYNWPSRVVNFFMVICAVGVVSIPSGLIAAGFVDIVQSKAKARRAQRQGGSPGIAAGGQVGDDWYEQAYRELEGVDPPPSRFGPTIDKWQNNVNEFLNGKEDASGNTQYTTMSKISRAFIFTIIILNVAAVLAESIPSVDAKIGNEPGNLFDVFEALSVFVFACEYIARLFSAPKNREALYSTAVYATTFFGIVDFLSTAPWFIEQILIASFYIQKDDDNARIFRIFRIFRILQLEDFIIAFSKLDNVFRASKDVLKATGLMALIIWVGCGALFYIFEENNPNWRSCDESIPPHDLSPDQPGCYDFATTAECNAFYDGMCEQHVFTNMPNSLYLTAVFLGGEWGVVDFTWPGRLVCLFLCVVGIGLYAIPVGALFDSFGAVLGMGGDDEEDEEEGGEES